MTRRRSTRTTNEAFRFVELEPFRSTQSPQFDMLSELVAEAATWFFGDPIFADAGTTRPHLGEPSAGDLLDAVSVGAGMYEQASSDRTGRGGAAVVDVFCRRFIDGEPDYALKLRSGRSIGQRQLLCALTLRQLEFAARAIKAGDAPRVAICMTDILELICEARRALDREAGSDVASRRARQRHKNNYRIRRMAEERFDATPGRSVLARATAIYGEVEQFSKELRAPLTPTRGPKTVYDWLRLYAKRSTPAG